MNIRRVRSSRPSISSRLVLRVLIGRVSSRSIISRSLSVRGLRCRIISISGSRSRIPSRRISSSRGVVGIRVSSIMGDRVRINSSLRSNISRSVIRFSSRAISIRRKSTCVSRRSNSSSSGMCGRFIRGISSGRRISISSRSIDIRSISSIRRIISSRIIVRNRISAGGVVSRRCLVRRQIRVRSARCFTISISISRMSIVRCRVSISRISSSLSISFSRIISRRIISSMCWRVRRVRRCGDIRSSVRSSVFLIMCIRINAIMNVGSIRSVRRMISNHIKLPSSYS